MKYFTILLLIIQLEVFAIVFIVSVEEERSVIHFVIKLEKSFTQKTILNMSNSIKLQLSKKALNTYVMNNVDCCQYLYQIIRDYL